MRWIMPLVLILIFVILYLTYNDFMDAVLMMMAVPEALVGGVFFLWLTGHSYSVAVQVGFIACFGMATETGIIMLVYLREAIERRGGLENIKSLEELKQAVVEGAVHRLRPKLLTEGVAIVALAPMLWASRRGTRSALRDGGAGAGRAAGLRRSGRPVSAGTILLGPPPPLAEAARCRRCREPAHQQRASVSPGMARQGPALKQTPPGLPWVIMPPPSRRPSLRPPRRQRHMAKHKLHLTPIPDARIRQPQRFRRILGKIAAKAKPQFRPSVGQQI